MNISIATHLTTVLKLSYDGDGSSLYTIRVYNSHKRLVTSKTTTNTYVTIHDTFPTGFYTVDVCTEKKTHTVHSVVPAMFRLSSGGCGFLMSGFPFGLDFPVLVTAFHCVRSKDNVPLITCHFETASVQPDASIFWAHSERYKDGGIDYCVMGISDKDVTKLRAKNIFPHEMSYEGFTKNNIGLLCHLNIANGNKMLKTVCNIVERNASSARYVYEPNFPNSSSGSSGSPMFGLTHDNKLTVQGLHIGSGKCTMGSSIVFDIKNHLITR